MAVKERAGELKGPGSAEHYGTDFFEWTQATAELIRQGRFDEVDWEHVAEEINDMGLRDQREVRSRLIVLMLHLLKWQFQPERRGSPSWQSTIFEQRKQLQLVIGDSPSLKRVPREELASLYPDAVRRATAQTGLTRFPKDCPYTPEQILDDDFWPS